MKTDMKPEDWETVYGESVSIIEEQIIAAFRPEQIEAAKAKDQENRPLLVAKRVLA